MTHPSVHARTYPNKIAYQMAATGKAITYRELDELSNQGAHLLLGHGRAVLIVEDRIADLPAFDAAGLVDHAVVGFRAGCRVTAATRS